MTLGFSCHFGHFLSTAKLEPLRPLNLKPVNLAPESKGLGFRVYVLLVLCFWFSDFGTIIQAKSCVLLGSPAPHCLRGFLACALGGS